MSNIKPFPVALGTLEAVYSAMPKVAASEVFQGLKGKADKGASFLRFAWLAWNGSISLDQTRKEFTGTLKGALVAAHEYLNSCRTQGAAMPGEEVGRAWSKAQSAWDSSALASAQKAEEKAAKDPAKPTSEKESTPSDVAMYKAEIASQAALITALRSASSIKEVRALLGQFDERKAA